MKPTLRMPMTLPRVTVAWVLLLANPAFADPAQTAADYSALPAHKALAVAVDAPTIRGIASGEPSDQSASVTALQNCAAQRGPAGICELSRLNDAHVTTGAEIRARVPRPPHPLFLWEYRAGASTVYLAGSIHVMKPSLFPLPAQFDAAFTHANRLAAGSRSHCTGWMPTPWKRRTSAMEKPSALGWWSFRRTEKRGPTR